MSAEPAIPTQRCAPSLGWLFAAFAAMGMIHSLASVLTYRTIELLASPSEFARAVRAMELELLPYYRATGYVTVIGFLLGYLRPLIAYFRAGCPAGALPSVQRAAVGFPLVGAVAGMVPWAAGTVVFPLITLSQFGKWLPELASQEIISPLVNGFLATTTTYLFVDWLFRSRVVPYVFPGGGATDVRGAMTLSVRGRLLVFLFAVAFIPMFTMLGLARTTEARFASGADIASVVALLAMGSMWVFVLYTVLGIVLTLVLARTLTEPITQVARALAPHRHGETELTGAVESADELGRLQEGVNNMTAALRDRARILSAFGRVVEPAIRDRLLSGELHGSGELRPASVLFVDLRGFTAMAERDPPGEVVATLNEFFTAVGAWVRDCGGFVDKYIGDAALVVFGLFDEDEDGSARAAAAAVRCATGICDRLEDLNRLRGSASKAPLAVTVAVHSGDVLAGTIGATDRHEYTVIGDTVNVAARLQQIAKDTGDGLVVSRVAIDLAALAGVHVGNGISEKIVLRGRLEPVEYFSLSRVAALAPTSADQPKVRD